VQVWEVAAREEIRELVARYAHCADGGRLDELAALFAEDGELRIDDRPALRGRDEIRAFLGGTRDGLHRSHSYRNNGQNSFHGFFPPMKAQFRERHDSPASNG